MNGIRHFMRQFTALSVKEHLRDQIDSESPALTRNEIELVRFMEERRADLTSAASAGQRKPT